MLHFSDQEFSNRRAQTRQAMEAAQVDALLVFAPENQFWLTGHDTFGYCFFQCLVVTAEREALLTRSADLRQAQMTSTLTDIRVWKDAAGANPADDLKALLAEMGLTGKRLGIETDTHGLTAMNWRRVEAALGPDLIDASYLISNLRLVKSPAEIAFIRKAAELTDLALDAALPLLSPGTSEADILAAMQGAILSRDGDYPANEFIIGSGEQALLCRYTTGRQVLRDSDQLTLEWSGAYRHYHAAAMRTCVIGEPMPKHEGMFEAAKEALLACEAAMQPGQPMADVFDAHARVLDAHGLHAARLNACGYSQGARFSPSWMEHQMFYEGNSVVMEENMAFFLHMILADSDSGTAMTLGRTSLVTKTGAEPLARHPLELIVSV